ncbi:bifunctional diaminohydroxyphosphoribosylaminopyrimidine deaminase/5-amino-6-(5-phosphoribosylamino)uracil reductase RibD [Eisenibacter elegans]|jgi:diaminohydroxyphosphoribosylaminopyrimidine deaminase/5-amino-6-(5-phosphoribosylamino)uracil reductase|uniref:bifunctional diaminohydroxyphosphoribosylaminopyrimidine deaminase/5-amino-6-(5-phosphoribosylamino)uracil reductase RibD n=1 Tax=Eisenibacter elegans TaxID=997 RepID=UPI00041F4873|nr:bifunctional diaminohydroxyphosphoribosylaminopyrimidine deaminase/5-amino-6-(5-phosphoribosylamino)uracil reductase RibD [Eisenibacter elegans]
MNHEMYMRRALWLATRGRGLVSPNPMVGCVIVARGEVIGEGWHQRYGQAHAEVNAVRAVKDPTLIAEATVYVTLEPCAHIGKTPPCADMLVDLRPALVVIACTDPNPKVAGQGIAKLQEAGIPVLLGVLEQEARQLNRRFLTAIAEKRPYWVLKWAQTADGFLARADYDSRWISNPLSRMWVHRWRSEEDAVLVGKNTAHYDNPQLNVRQWEGRDPHRLVIDRHNSLAPSLHLFQGEQPTICYNFSKNQQTGNTTWVALPQNDFWQALSDDLYQRGIHSVLVEGGTAIFNALLNDNRWDELHCFEAQEQVFEQGIPAPAIPPGAVLQTRQTILNDHYSHYLHPRHQEVVLH